MIDTTEARQASVHPSRRLFILAAVTVCVSAAWSQPASAPGVLQPIVTMAARSIEQVHAADAAGARATLERFESLWKPVEDGVRARNLDIYARVEVESSRAEAALGAAPPDLSVAEQALVALQKAAGDYATAAPPTATTSGQKGLSALITVIGQVKQALASGDDNQASDLLGSFQEMWPLAEGDVQTRSIPTYNRVESEITQASALLLSGPGARDRALDVVGAMLAQLEGLTGAAGYSAWDAALILLREGMEALLVLAALLAALKKAGNAGGARWIWAGAGTGILASGALAVLLVFVITAATAGATRETMEGAVGLASVLVMLTVGAWLHGKSSLKAWNGFIKGKVGGAVASGRMWSLYFLALLAVLREGAEATVFYIGIAQGIGLGQLLLGIGAAVLIIVIARFPPHSIQRASPSALGVPGCHGADLLPRIQDHGGKRQGASGCLGASFAFRGVGAVGSLPWNVADTGGVRTPGRRVCAGARRGYRDRSEAGDGQAEDRVGEHCDRNRRATSVAVGFDNAAAWCGGGSHTSGNRQE